MAVMSALMKTDVRNIALNYAAFVLLAFVASTAAAAQVQGQRPITIETEPQAKIWINGVLYGSTSETGSLKIASVSPGKKTIRVRADGFKEAEKLLTANQSGTVSIPLTRTTDEAELAFQNAERLASVDRQKAILAYQKAVELRPGFTDALIGLARIYTETGDIEKADNAIAAAKRSRPGTAEISAVEGRFLKSVDEEAKAIAAFKRSIKEGGGFQPEAYTGLGLLYKEKAENFGAEGDYRQEAANYAEAAKYLTTAIKQLSGAPDSPVLYQFLGLIYEQQKKNSEAIRVYQEFLDNFPGHPESEAFQSFITQLKKDSQQPE